MINENWNSQAENTPAPDPKQASESADFFTLTRTIDGQSDPDWALGATIAGSWAQLCATLDLSKGIPFGWRLRKGKAARRYLKWALKHERRYQHQKHSKRNATGDN